ncbi:fructosamine kinase family protein [Thiohalocapsa marina]|uniref:Fructosamine kinase family protein n=1 Tax=Thiohalocapsa marina TaxID=424902 RepID=A0A5M8FQC2_9GAMM|nr:fructosamine kinase family protein [Thiohalocapsa marina]KAA6185391.1 fructosamine kinase family protein [Thiohalocapsa marina]
MNQHIARQIADACGRPFTPGPPRAVGGGCINAAMVLSDGDQSWFVKHNAADRLPMFQAEFEGLQAMAATDSIRVPRPLCTGSAGNAAFIAMEYIPFEGQGGGASAARAGEQLAAMHRATAPRFGWHRDNTIGSTPQPNAPTPSWIDFWRRQRLGFQLDLASRLGYGSRLADRGALLLENCDALIDHDPAPSLLHGDLWGGNLSIAAGGEPVVFDPACYYGDREADIAMTELFGGFGHDFHRAYHAAWPLDAGYAVRKTLYNLYHTLNHLNLFGPGYLSQAEGMIDRLLAEVRA